ncbi:DUF5343 domain-containing protein [Sphingomonas sp. So64.6b]|uniref:DUF5343 domain-containing protein n=1 Tax=Sphingomonas sp. So64.6b TaxID=2997354 RepID=UPI001602DF80|nr:DUF5343 domain-containing protein [Sphingomonas sp. So64.6b]QNA83631.1 DUF5343 domain-containing protein [Sphingomonas sp. So64.6b]
MASHPYISGPGNIAQMIGYLRKNFPATVTSDTVKKYSIAPNNESYVINSLRFINIIDEEGKRTSKGHDVFLLGDEEFSKAFEVLVRESYADLFELRADDAWTMTKSELTSYFRATDKTSELIGSRQASVFIIFRGLAGHEQPAEKSVMKTITKSKSVKPKASPTKVAKTPDIMVNGGSAAETIGGKSARDMALTVRIEINLPANGSQETYDNIFKSIRANLINE